MSKTGWLIMALATANIVLLLVEVVLGNLYEN